MSVNVKELRSKKDFRSFIYLPEELHRDHPNWLPPIYLDEKRYFNPRRNRSFGHCDTVLLLVSRDGRPVGRIMGIIHRRSNEIHGENNARFGFMECGEDQEVAHALLQTIEDWAARQGASRMVGPMGFSDQDPEGFMIEGFENTPTIACTYNLGYMNRLVINEGYRKEIDYVVYKVPVPDRMPENQLRIQERALRRGRFRVAEFSQKRKLKPLIRPVLSLMNECFKDIYGYVPFDDKDMIALARRYLPVLDPRFVKIVLDQDGQVSGFIIGIPNMAEGIRRSRGRLFPCGFFWIRRAAKRTRQLDLLLGGVKEKYRGAGLDSLLGLKIMESAQKAGFTYLDSHRELETNLKVRAEMERWGGIIYKRYRIYQKEIRPS